MRKLLIISVLFFSALLFCASFGAKSAHAQVLGSSAIVSGYLDNTSGTIPITVTISFYSGNAGSPFLLPPPNPKVYQVPAGQRVQASYTDLVDEGWYEITWSTSCSDPPALAISSVVPGAYIFPTQNVACQTPNATPAITNTACATVGWTLTGVGVDGANIGSFSVYLSQNSSDIGPGDPVIGPYASGLSPGTRSYDFGAGGKSGTYYVRVRAVSPQGVGSWSSVGSFNCGAAITPASNLNQTASCNGSGPGNIVAVNFTWTPSSGGSTAQYLDYSVFNNNFGSGTYSSVNVGAGASSYNFSSGFPQGITFYWRVNNQISGNWYPSVTANFFTPSCPVGATPTPTPAATATPGPVCPGGCTAPADISDSWGQPTGYAEGTDSNLNASNCSSSGTSCNTPLSSFTGGAGVIYAVHTGSTSGPKIKNGAGTTAGGPCYCTSNGVATFTWSWSYDYVYCEVGAITDTTCVFNPTVVTVHVGTSTSGTVPGPKPNTYYHRESWALDGSGGQVSRVWNQTSKTAGCVCPTPVPTPTPVLPVITLSGYSDCVDGVNPLVHLTWTSNTGNTGYTVFRDGGSQGSLGNVRSWNSPGAQPSGSHSWLVQGTGGAFGTINSNTISIVTATCSPPPADPSNLVATTACDASGNPVITFRWQDNSNIEQGFWMDVSHDAFTGPSSTTASPSVWGVKGITRSAAETAAVGVAVQFVWNNAATTNTAGQLDSGDVDSAVAGNQLAPERGVIYYWRVKAYSVDRQSNHVYPTSTTVPPGISFTAPTCMFDLQVSNNPAGNTQVYDPGAVVSFKVQVTNTTAAQVAYPGGGNLGAWTQSNSPAGGISCPGPGAAPVVNPPTNTIQSIPISSLAIGASTIITLANFTAPTAPGSYVANFYALPTCTPANDSNWTNNGFQLTYVVSAKAWFQTVGGDVGANGNIQVSNPTPPGAQSSYVLAGNPLDASVVGKWELNNYAHPLFPTNNTRVYDYLNSRFAAKATMTGCSIGAAGIEHCTGDMSVGATNMTTAGNWIIFVDGNLNVTGNITVGATTTLVFIVRNNITINTNVTQADGVYIAGGTFADYDNTVGKSRNTTPYKLTISGAVYAHNFDLSAFLSGLPACIAAAPSCDNSTTPTEYVVYQPRYLITLSQLIGSPSVSWQEVAP